MQLPLPLLCPEFSGFEIRLPLLVPTTSQWRSKNPEYDTLTDLTIVLRFEPGLLLRVHLVRGMPTSEGGVPQHVPSVLVPKGPCTQKVYTLAPIYLHRDYFKAKVYTGCVDGPARFHCGFGSPKTFLILVSGTKFHTGSVHGPSGTLDLRRSRDRQNVGLHS